MIPFPPAKQDLSDEPGRHMARRVQGMSRPAPLPAGRKASTVKLALALLLMISAGAARAGSLRPSLASDRDRVSALIAAASLPGISPERQAARDELFREVKPRLLAEGMPASPSDAAALTRAVALVPCVAGRPRLVRAVVDADLAYVAVAGERGGGCTYLMRRDGDRWVELLPLGWTLQA